jgi:hypothetical protein
MNKLAAATARLAVIDPDYSLAESSPADKKSVLFGVEPLSAMTMTFILLVLSHYLIIVEYNLRLILLRLLSIIVPLCLGFICRENPKRRTLAVEFGYGLIVAILAILVMSTVVSKVDKVPVLPQDFYEWKEFAEYGASIAFGFFTGVILRRIVIATNSSVPKPPWLIAVASRALTARLGGAKAGLNMKTAQLVVSTAAAIASVTMSIVTGLSRFF